MILEEILVIWVVGVLFTLILYSPYLLQMLDGEMNLDKIEKFMFWFAITVFPIGIVALIVVKTSKARNKYL